MGAGGEEREAGRQEAGGEAEEGEREGEAGRRRAGSGESTTNLVVCDRKNARPLLFAVVVCIP